MSVNYFDCTYTGFDPDTRLYVVTEQLYPEARGWIEHRFPTEAEARAWMDSLPRTRE